MKFVCSTIPVWFVLMCSVYGILSGSRSTSAQEAPAMPEQVLDSEVKEKLQWLQKFVGSWETKMESPTSPGQPPIDGKGTIQCRALGDLWIVSDMRSEMSGTKVQGVQTVGFDESAGKYVGTWVDSMFNHMWRYEGWVDDTGQVLTLEAEGPNFMADGESTKFRDIYEFESNDKITLYSKMLDADGEWVTIMSGVATRTK